MLDEPLDAPFAYEREPYRCSLEVEVLEVGDDEHGPWAVLDDTLLYPEGGGQPADRGVLGGVSVLDVQRQGRRIVHRLARTVGVGETSLALDWTRRFDHMQQHTAQHLLSAIAQDRFGWPTTSFHLSASTCDVELDVETIPADERDRLEEAVAAEIRAARPISTRRVDRQELEELGSTVRSRGLPEELAGGVRLVEIEGLDLNTCGGTHLRNTAEIETVKLVGVERMRGGTRLHWLAGGRVRRRLALDEERLATLRGLLECADDELVDLAGRKLEGLGEARRKIERLREELAESAARALAESSEPVVDAHFPDEDGGFLQRVARSFSSSEHDGVALLTAGAGDEAVFLVVAGQRGGRDVSELGRAVAEVLDGRGGGRGSIFQGRAGSLAGIPAALEILRSTR